jgi:hypothetical protein
MASFWINYSRRFHTMPYKHNESRRHKIKKSGYKVTNWHDYNNGLRKRGDFTIWFTEEAVVDWHPAKAGARGRPKKYSDIAIETAVFIRQVFHLPLRQTEGLLNSLARVMKAEITIPDFSSISKRSIVSSAGNKRRDQHIQTITQQGRIAWQQKTDYNLRNHSKKRKHGSVQLRSTE